MKKISSREVPGGVTAPAGFTAAGTTAGLKQSGSPDTGIILSEAPCTAAGTFTTNRICAPCVVTNRNLLPSEDIRAILCNSGNANACTGEQGFEDVQAVTAHCEKRLNLPAGAVLTASTGIIGEFLPVNKITAATDTLAKNLRPEGSRDFATAIMTTDTTQKEYALEVEFTTGHARIGGCAKGAGMIQPNMATMLGFITTDIAIDTESLSFLHKRAVEMTFNNLTVDGDTSTNDMVLIAANGTSGVTVECEKDIEILQKALFTVYNRLCAQIAEDGEGATKRIEINVYRGADFADCRRAAKAVANSNLVKTAMFGNDPNWGRILCAVGYSGASFDPDTVQVRIGDTTVYQDGGPADFEPAVLSKMIDSAVVHITVDLGFNTDTHAVAQTCDFSYDYVKINAEYHT
ncbi:MAG: bifunctional glutamate N-acetyltransferase/amino-acid acetyltransferase ArgJ [Fibrobacterota bacterium]